MAIDTSRIFTSQGRLEDALEDPGLDLVMNLFRIPRVFAVGGFDGTWNVGKHSYLVAILSIFWAKFNNWKEAKRDKLVTFALLHDLHESVTGDILPMFKTSEVREELDRLQDKILEQLGVHEDPSLKSDLKFMDLLAFLYEIKCAPIRALDAKQPGYANDMITEQKDNALKHCAKNGISKQQAMSFMKKLNLW